MHARLWRALGSLKFRLAAAALLALALGIGISTAVLVQRAESNTLGERSTREITEAARTARLLSRQVVLQQRTLAALAAQLPAAVVADWADLHEKLRMQSVLLTQFDSITVVDATGRGLQKLDSQGVRAATVDIGDRDYFQRAQREQRPVISDPVIARIGNELVIMLTQPLPDNGGQVMGALRLRQRNLLAGVADASVARGPRSSRVPAGSPAPGTDTDTASDSDPDGNAADAPLVLVADARGHILAHPDPRLIGAPLSAEPELAGALERWREAGAPVEPAGLDFSDGTNLISVAGVAGPDWLVWQSTPRSGVLAPLARARHDVLRWALGLTLLLALGLLAWLALLLRPLARLERRAERLFDGSLDPQAGWPQAGGEIGRLERVLRHVAAERAQLEAFNHRVIQRLESVMAAAPVGIAFTRGERFELVSRQFCQLLARDEARLLGQPAPLIFASNEDYMRLGGDVASAFDGGQAYDGEWQLLRSDGTRVWARLRAQPVDRNEAQAGIIWTANDITQEMHTRQALEWAATHDPLTGMANRAAFDERVARLFSARPRSLPAALVVLDLDRFKPINDLHGHAAGDAMLRAIADAAALRVRPGDLLVRLGGDEFAVVLERCTADVAARVAEDLRGAISAVRLPWHDRLLDVGASAGVAMLSDLTADTAAWLADADRACYEAKAAGRGRVLEAQALHPPALLHPGQTAHPASGHAALRLVVDVSRMAADAPLTQASRPDAALPPPVFQSSQS